MYLIEKGAIGLAVLISVWQMIYSNEGYYVTNNKDLHLLIKKKIDIDVNEVSDCINVCLERNVFNQELHNSHNILTSKAIQKRFFEAAKKKKSVVVVVDYIINGINSVENWVNVSGNATNVKEKVKVKEEVKVKKKEPYDLSNLPDGVTEGSAKDFIEHRKKLKAPLTQHALDLAMAEAVKAPAIGLTPVDAINETIQAGWKGIKIEWLKNRIGGNNNAASQQTHTPKVSLGERATQHRKNFEESEQSGDGELMGADDSLVRA